MSHVPDQDLNALQIRVALAGIEPAVWRRLVVPWTWNLSELHLVLQAAFNWHGDPVLCSSHT